VAEHIYGGPFLDRTEIKEVDMRLFRNITVMLLMFALIVSGAFAGGQQEGGGDGDDVTMLEGAPAPFDGSEKLTIAHVSYLLEGEFMQMYRAGAEAQAELMDMDFITLGKQTDAQAQANFVQQAISQGVDGIVIQHGVPESLQSVAQEALDAGIPVVAFDVDLDNEDIPQVAQNDPQHGYNAINAIREDFNGDANIAYVYTPGILPLDKRDSSIQEVVSNEPDMQIVEQTGTLESPIAVKNADQAKAVLRANDTIDAYLAPYDEFAKGIVLALEELDMTDEVKVYSVDISTQDIELMTKEGSPWVMTSAVNPAAVGAASVRTLALVMAGEDVPHDVLVPTTVFTQEMLRENNVSNMDELREAFPEFNRADVSTAPWIPMGAGEMF
jgi:simple sugar transport system substrate-binding protein